jgi:hypothetical protein
MDPCRVNRIVQEVAGNSRRDHVSGLAPETTVNLVKPYGSPAARRQEKLGNHEVAVHR